MLQGISHNRERVSLERRARHSKQAIPNCVLGWRWVQYDRWSQGEWLRNTYYEIHLRKERGTKVAKVGKERRLFVPPQHSKRGLLPKKYLSAIKLFEPNRKSLIFVMKICCFSFWNLASERETTSFQNK